MKRKKIRIFTIALAAVCVLFLALAGCFYIMYKNQDPTVMAIKDDIKVFLCDMRLPRGKDLDEGFKGAEKADYNGQSVLSGKYADRLINYAKGYSIDLPSGCNYDFSLAPSYAKIAAPGDPGGTGDPGGFELKISREYSTEDDVGRYIYWYLFRFVLEEWYQETNDIELLCDETTYIGQSGQDEQDGVGFARRVITIRTGGFPDGVPNCYTYVTFETGTRIFYFLMFKYSSSSEDAPGTLRQDIVGAIDSFRFFRPSGSDVYDVAFAPSIPETWSDSVRKVYSDISLSVGDGGSDDGLYWGFLLPTCRAAE